MTVETVLIETLCRDPANVRVHSPRNLDAIKASLKRFGQQKPIVVDSNGIVRAGNGTLAAAQALGWRQIQIVRTLLAGSDATAFAIADNRTSDLSEWDDNALAMQLDALRADGFDVREIGFGDPDDRERLDKAAESLGEEKWMVVVTCDDEADQAEFLEQMKQEDRVCKALMA